MMKEKKKHIVILTGQHVSANPRVWKEANALVKFGYAVTILTTWYSLEKLEEDKKLLDQSVIYKPAVNLIKSLGAWGDTIFSRFVVKMAFGVKRFLNLDSEFLLIHRPNKQFKLALTEQADLYISHQESGLVTGCKLLKQKKKVAFDFEDWYSEDYVSKTRAVSLLKKKEKEAFQNGCYCSFPSESMRDAFFKAYSLAQKTAIIYNSFPDENNSSDSEFIARRKKSLVWFSQVIGPGRGLESLILALNHIDEKIELHLLGQINTKYKESLISFLHKRHELFFYEPIPHNEINKFLSSFQIGLAIENKFPESRNVTVTNKILQYIQAGNFVFATATKGQSEIARALPQNVYLESGEDVESWAQGIRHLLNLANADSKVPNNALNYFSWALQEKKLTQLIEC